MELKTGGLYETKHGKRFRVTNTDHGIFECSSFGGTWGPDGRAYGQLYIDGRYRRPHLIREVEETRWVPATREEFLASIGNVAYAGKHYKKLVSRDEAKAIAQAGRDKAVLNSVMSAVKTESLAVAVAPVRSGEVRVKDKWGLTVGFTWAISNDMPAVLNIETTSGVKISLPL